MLDNFLYTLIYNFPKLTTRKIHQLAWLYKRVYINLDLDFDWDDGYCTAKALDEARLALMHKKILQPHRPYRGRPLHMFRWTVMGKKHSSLYERWSIDILETLKYYVRDENEQELKIKTIELRIRDFDLQSVYSHTVRKSMDRRIGSRNRGGRNNPQKKVVARHILHKPVTRRHNT